MTNRQKNILLGAAILIVMFLIIINHKKKTEIQNAEIPFSTPFFPSQKEPQTEAMQALLSGKLKLDGN
ncbi:MAG: hypothetical protein H7Y07_00775 [Pyrinomonadaceae bacterium]|nr:hypothetical protein [Sphingobacteriaceae bacterium]